MKCNIVIVRKMKNILLIFINNQLYKKIDFKQRNDGLYVCKWSNIESGSYSFSLEDENGNLKGVTYNHTAPFATDFEAKTEENNKYFIFINHYSYIYLCKNNQ